MTSQSDRRTAFLDEMGIGPVWKRRAGDVPRDAPPREHGGSLPPAPGEPFLEALDHAPELLPSSTAPPAQEIGGMDWEQLQVAVAGCTRCGLCQSRTKTVFGVGDPKANWLFVGEGPGRNEDLKGEPFIGPAGKLLDNMLLAMGLRRGSNAFITNIVKCRPTGPDGRDRPPTPEEAAACLPYLQRQIALIQPAIIVALGKTAALSLLGLEPDTPVGSLRGKVHRYAGLPLVVTYHPAYLLRKLGDKGKAWSDLCLAMNAYSESSAETSGTSRPNA